MSVALGVSHAMRTRRIFVCGLSGPDNIFPQYFIKGTIFRKKKSYLTENVCLDLLYNFAKNISHYKKNSTRYDKNLYRSSCKVPIILVRFLKNLNFLEMCSKNTQISNFIKIRPVEAELFHVD